LAVAFGGWSAHRLFMFADVISADPVLGLSAPPQKPKRSPFHKVESATPVALPTVSGLSLQPPHHGSPSVHLLERLAASGGEMLFKIAFVLLVAWLLGVLRMYPGGNLVHVLLLTA
jgi:uncharacterized protein DUF5670